MNSNLAEVGKPTRWPPGKSGNPAGKPPGTRTAFSQGFIRDFALVWAEEGLEAVRKVAKKSPEAFVAIAARICPNDVRLTLEQAIPGGMLGRLFAHARSDCCYQGRLARSRPIAARSGISEFAARSQLKWAREGDAWILLYRRRRMGRVVPDKEHPGMWRSVKVDGILSEAANLCWSKNNVMAQAIREVAWDAANTPSKSQQNRGCCEQKSTPIRLNASGALFSRIAGPMMPPQRVRRAARHMWPARLSVHC
jgi:hypothetical protein